MRPERERESFAVGFKGAHVLIQAVLWGTGASVWENHYGTVMELKSRSTLIKKTQAKQALNSHGPGSYLRPFNRAYLIRDAAEGGSLRNTTGEGMM